ncbi:hypothetical protein NCCP1664_13450 [Zafaria cholistanensis]|uniref:Uncharacterized protein n=1 Tax=Zafaria cholistanensis TaxID=1682741 RepID=A0A5A7NSP4_9MICC|nr:hypothetical protein [Zafaria cholistanensis]GER22848.1 hypothetical protein NCCP1664_13450 [Zafaria cholistanensis]
MKTSPDSSRRRLLASTGAVLGLLATIGVATPAQAAAGSPVVVQAHRDHDNKDRYDWNHKFHDRNYDRSHWNNHRHHHDDDASLRLRIDDDGDYRIRGYDYEDNRVKVWLVNVSRDRVVDRFAVRPNNSGDFRVYGDDLRCNRTYQAVSWSEDDGREYSNKVRFHCDHK